MKEKIKWIQIRPGLFTRPVDPEIQARMPVIEPKKHLRQKISEFLYSLTKRDSGLRPE